MKKRIDKATEEAQTAAKPPRPLRKGMSYSFSNTVNRPAKLTLRKEMSDHSVQSRLKSPGSRIEGHKKLQHRTRSASNTARDSIDCFGNLTASQASVLRSSWKYIYNSRGKATSRILTKLENQCPRVKEIFYKSAFLSSFAAPSGSGSGSAISLRRTGSVNDHSKLIAKMLEDVFLNIQNADKAASDLREIGSKHASLKQYGFSSDIWEKFGEFSLEVIGSIEGIQQNKEAARACRYLIACITDELRYGYEQECKHACRLKSSVSVEIDHMAQKLDNQRLAEQHQRARQKSRHHNHETVVRVGSTYNNDTIVRVESAPIVDRKFTAPSRYL